MKTTRLFFLLIASLMMAACGSDDSNGGGEGGDANVNANQPTAKHPEVTRYEFPKLKGGSSVIVTHKTSGTYDASNINFSTEWDNDKLSQRWTCYQMHKGFGGNSGRYSGNPQYPFDSDLAAAGGKYLDDDYFWSSGFDHSRSSQA